MFNYSEKDFWPFSTVVGNHEAVQTKFESSEKEDIWRLTAPGARKDGFKVFTNERFLIVKYNHPEDAGYAPFVKFEKKFYLYKEWSLKKASADYKDGVLSITLPKAMREGTEIKVNG